MVHEGKQEVTKADLTIKEEEVMHWGYKTHVSHVAETGIVTSMKPTRDNPPLRFPVQSTPSHQGQDRGLEPMVLALN